MFLVKYGYFTALDADPLSRKAGDPFYEIGVVIVPEDKDLPSFGIPEAGSQFVDQKIIAVLEVRHHAFARNEKRLHDEHADGGDGDNGYRRDFDNLEKSHQEPSHAGIIRPRLRSASAAAEAGVGRTKKKRYTKGAYRITTLTYPMEQPSILPLLVIGLGNPGEEYALTYHNAGAIALSVLEMHLREKEAQAPSGRYGHFSYVKFPSMILVRPGVYMNESGIAAEEALRFFNAGTDRLIVLHDETDLPLGTWRLEDDRGSAGHHGVESIVERLGTKAFIRGRIGVRPEETGGPRKKAGDFVLKRLSERDKDELQRAAGELARKLIEKT